MTVVLTKRGIVISDSLSSFVCSDDGSAPDARRLWVNQIANATGIGFHNLSAPGNRISVGLQANGQANGTEGNSVVYNIPALNFLRGSTTYGIAIVLIGTNDYAASDISAFTALPWNAHTNLRQVFSYLKANSVKTLVVQPLWRSDEATCYPHPDGAWPLSTWRSWITAIAGEYAFPVLPYNCFDLCPDDFVQDTPTLKLHLNGCGHDKLFAGILAKLQMLGWVPTP